MVTSPLSKNPMAAVNRSMGMARPSSDRATQAPLPAVLWNPPGLLIKAIPKATDRIIRPSPKTALRQTVTEQTAVAAIQRSRRVKEAAARAEAMVAGLVAEMERHRAAVMVDRDRFRRRW
jgi:hypothetical protein